MKSWKLVAAFLAVALTGTTAMADDTGGSGKIAFGGQGGIVFSDFHTDNAPFGNNFNQNTGWMAGAFLEFGVFAITLRPEANYVRTGFNVGGLATVHQNYLEIPLLVKINPFAKAAVSPFIVVGPSWSKHLSTDVSVLGSNPFTANYDRNFWSGVVGIGADINLGENVAFNIQGRYNFGLNDQDTSNIQLRSRSVYVLGGLSIQN